MQAQEAQLITDLFERLRPFDSQPRDPEAERLIAGCVSRQPSTAYLLTQTVLVQEQALKAAQARIAELEAKAAGAQSPSAGFLASAPKIGPWGAAPAAPTPAPAPRSPWGAPPAQPAGGGSFLRSALTTAAGVAGGALLFEGIRNLLGNSNNPFSTAAAAAPLMPPDQVPGGSFTDQAQSDPFSRQAYASDDDAADDDYGLGASDDTTYDDNDI